MKLQPINCNKTLAKMSLVIAFTHNRSSNTHVALMAQVHFVTLLPIENPLSHENKNRCLLEQAITFERQGIFTTPTYYRLRIVCRVI